MAILATAFPILQTALVMWTDSTLAQEPTTPQITTLTAFIPPVRPKPKAQANGNKAVAVHGTRIKGVNNMLYELHITGEGTFLFQVVDKTTNRTKASYRIVDYSTTQGSLFVVHPLLDDSKALRVDTLVQAQEVAKADYMAKA